MNASILLSAWETASAQLPGLRAGALVAALHDADAAAFDIGMREREALRVCAAIAGDMLDAEACCARCGERMDIALPLAALDATPDTRDEIEHDGWRIGLRVPHAQDVTFALESEDSETALFARCVRFASQNGCAMSPDAIPPALRERCEAQLDRLAPLANLALAVACPECGHADTVAFDAGEFAVERIGHWAEDELEAVARLCTLYPWSEAQVLAMSPWRRQFYLVRAEAR
ncbi:hypothetical protein CR51_41480 [Caballeronia megalochromosomata]|jgi:hypothetical protein|nr:hypothetical protein CR51_41480 [Caballeronia megalochromosomata]